MVSADWIAGEALKMIRWRDEALKEQAEVIDLQQQIIDELLKELEWRDDVHKRRARSH
jgi:hypothetical protein